MAALLSKPATIADIKLEETNFATNLGDIQDKNNEIEEKAKDIDIKEK